MEYNYRVAQRVYASTYANIAQQFKIYLNSLPLDKIDEIENDFRANGNSYFLFTKQKVQLNYLILLQYFTKSTAGFPIRTDILLFLKVKLVLELLKKN